MSEAAQRPFDATCRASHRFLTRPPGKRVIATRKRNKQPPATATHLDALIAEACIDAHGDSELASGFLACFEQIAVPFTTEVLGVEVSVTVFDLTGDDALVAVCRRGKGTQRIPVLNLPLPTPPPQGHVWLASYRRWCSGGAGMGKDTAYSDEAARAVRWTIDRLVDRFIASAEYAALAKRHQPQVRSILQLTASP